MQYYNKVEICGINTNSIKVLSEKEKTELLKKAQAGDKAARDALVEGNLKLVLSVVQRFANRSDSMDDLFQVGVIGLIKAIDNFNLDLNVRFSTYAVPTTDSRRKNNINYAFLSERGDNVHFKYS